MSNGFLTNGGTRFPSQRGLYRIRHILLRGIEEVGVDVCRRGNVAVPQPALNVLNVAACSVEQGRHAVPLRYNNDKPDDPLKTGRFECLRTCIHKRLNKV